MVIITTKNITNYNKKEFIEFMASSTNIIYHTTPVIGIKRSISKNDLDNIENNNLYTNTLVYIIVKLSMIYKIPIWVIEYSPVILIELMQLLYRN